MLCGTVSPTVLFLLVISAADGDWSHPRCAVGRQFEQFTLSGRHLLSHAIVISPILLFVRIRHCATIWLHGPRFLQSVTVSHALSESLTKLLDINLGPNFRKRSIPSVHRFRESYDERHRACFSLGLSKRLILSGHPTTTLSRVLRFEE